MRYTVVGRLISAMGIPLVLAGCATDVTEPRFVSVEQSERPIASIENYLPCPTCREAEPPERSLIKNAVDYMQRGGAASCRQVLTFIVELSAQRMGITINEEWDERTDPFGQHQGDHGGAEGHHHVNLNSTWLTNTGETTQTLWHEGVHHFWPSASELYADHFGRRCQDGQDPGPVW